jgi:hypothetical protein
MNPQTTEDKPMCAASIKKKLGLVEGVQAYFNFICNASLGEHQNLALGDQLRATEDYNGAIFEVVKVPYPCVVDAQGKVSDYEYFHQTYRYREMDEDIARQNYHETKAQEVKSLAEEGICNVNFAVFNYPLGRDVDDSDSDDDEIDQETKHFQVSFDTRKLPEGHSVETRVWVRKICLISKAEGLTDDKNNRSLTLTIKTIPFTDLIRKQVEILAKCSRSLQATRPDALETKKCSGWRRNYEKCNELMKLYNNPALAKRKVVAFGNTKYGLFLRNPVTYTITASGKNVMQQKTDMLMKAGPETDKTMNLKEALIKEIKRESDCLITDD